MACFPPLEFGANKAKNNKSPKPKLNPGIDSFCTRAQKAAMAIVEALSHLLAVEDFRVILVEVLDHSTQDVTA